VPARRAPDLGEHNEEILRQLGFDANQIERLRASGVVAEARQAEGATR
jgi:formyl-CoA transferase